MYKPKKDKGDRVKVINPNRNEYGRVGTVKRITWEGAKPRLVSVEVEFEGYPYRIYIYNNKELRGPLYKSTREAEN